MAQNEDEKYNLLPNLSYIGSNETDCYAVSRCKLDLYYPCNKNNYPTVIWFHGGGLTSGEKYIPEELKEKGIDVPDDIELHKPYIDNVYLKMP